MAKRIASTNASIPMKNAAGLAHSHIWSCERPWKRDIPWTNFTEHGTGPNSQTASSKWYLYICSIVHYFTGLCAFVPENKSGGVRVAKCGIYWEPATPKGILRTIFGQIRHCHWPVQGREESWPSDFGKGKIYIILIILLLLAMSQLSLGQIFNEEWLLWNDTLPDRGPVLWNFLQSFEGN
jgi:hypothetical protein